MDDVQNLFVASFFSLIEDKKYSPTDLDIPLTQFTANNLKKNDNLESENALSNDIKGKLELQAYPLNSLSESNKLNNFLNAILSNSKDVLESTCFDFDFDPRIITTTRRDNAKVSSSKVINDTSDIHCEENLHLDIVCRVIGDINELKQVFAKNYIDLMEKHNASLQAVKNKQSELMRQIRENQELVTHVEEKIKFLEIPSIKPKLPEVRMVLVEFSNCSMY